MSASGRDRNAETPTPHDGEPPFSSDDLRSFIAVVDFVPEGFAIYGPDNRLVVCNRALQELTGELSSMVMPGVSFKEFILAATERGLIPEARGDLHEWVQKIIDQVDGHPGFAEIRYGDRWVRMRRHLLPGGYTVLSARDITADVEAERTVRDSEELLRIVTDNVPAPIVYMDRNARYLFVNATCARWFGRRREEMIGHRVSDIIGEDQYQNLKPYQDAALGGAQVSFESTLTYPDGVTREVEITYAPHFTDSGKVNGFIALALDVSESRAAERRLAHSQRVEALGQLTGGIAHDFNNLLTVIIGNLRLAGHLAKDADEQLMNRVNTATRAAFRGAELVKRLLAFSRRQVLEPEALEVEALVTHLVDLLRRTLEENIGLEARVAVGVPKVNCDPAQLEAALLNLAINARDAMPRGGSLRIDVDRARVGEASAAAPEDIAAGDFVCLAVRDTGSGMPPEVSNRAFEPFFTTKDTGQGSGLGLSMVYGFAQQSGGFVELESSEGTGTTVRLFLPAFSGRADTARRAAQGELEGGNETVLVVEDEDEVREVAVAQIESLGYRVLEASDGQQALAILEQDKRVELMFTDMVMPGGMSGLDLARAACAKRPGLKVLYTSGYAQGVIEKGKTEPTAQIELLPKPYTDHDLARRLRAALDTP